MEVLFTGPFLFSHASKTDCINSIYYYCDLLHSALVTIDDNKRIVDVLQSISFFVMGINLFIKKEHRVAFKFDRFFEEVDASVLQGLSIQLISGDFLLPAKKLVPFPNRNYSWLLQMLRKNMYLMVKSSALTYHKFVLGWLVMMASLFSNLLMVVTV